MSSLSRLVSSLGVVAVLNFLVFSVMSVMWGEGFDWQASLLASVLGVGFFVVSGFVIGVILVVIAMIRANRSGDRYGDTYPHP